MGRNQARFSGCCPRIHGGIHGCRPPRGLRPDLTRPCSITPTSKKGPVCPFPHGSRAKWSSFPLANPTLKVILYPPEQAMEKGPQPAFPSVGAGVGGWGRQCLSSYLIAWDCDLTSNHPSKKARLLFRLKKPP